MYSPAFFRWLIPGLLLGAAPARLAAQGYHVDSYRLLGQNPGNLNQDFEFVPGGAAAGWTEVYRYQQNTPVSQSGMSRGLRLPAGFAFRFAGQPVTTIRAFSGGFITLDTTQTAITWINNALPNPQAPNRFVWLGYPFASGTAQARILTKVFGTAPHRQFWVQWNNILVANSTVYGALPAYASLVLEETTNRVHVVVQRNFWWGAVYAKLGAGMQLNGTTAWVTDSVLVRGPYQQDPRPLDNLTFTFEPGPRPAFDAAVWAVRVPAVLPAPGGAPTAIRGAVVNRGTQTLRNWQVAYRLDHGPVQTLAPVAAPLAPGDTAAFTFPAGWNRPAPGAYGLRVWVRTAAAQPDANANNDSLATTVQVVTRDLPRRVVQEIATSSTCPPCAIFDDSLRAYDRRHPNQPIERIAYPMDFPGNGDPYYLPEFRARAQVNVRNIRSVAIAPQVVAPMMVGDGATALDPTNRFYFPGLPPYQTLLDSLSRRPATVALTGTCQVRGDTVRGSVTLDPVMVLPGRTHTLVVVVTERRTTGNASTNGQTVFHDVAKKIVINRLLTAPLVPGQPLVVPYQQVFGAGHTVEDFDSLEVVAFVQESWLAGTSVPAAVAQAARFRPATPLGQPAAAPGPALTLAPNPATGRAWVHLVLPNSQLVRVAVLDALGRVVRTRPAETLASGAHALPLELGGLRGGLYLVRLTTGAGTALRRLVVE